MNRYFKLGLFALLFQSLVWANVVINEVHYEPEDRTKLIEFIEIYNNGDQAVDLSDWYLDSAVDYIFPANTIILSNGYLVIAQNAEAFESWFGFAPSGQWTGKLKNEGEDIELYNNFNDLIDLVDYKLEFPWPIASGGDGASMELINPNLDNELGSSWRSSNSQAVGISTTNNYISQESNAWRYRKGTSEPTNIWNELNFTEDSNWLNGQTSIGFGDGDDNTVLSDMQGNYISFYNRHKFNVDGDIPQEMTLRVYVDDGAVVWINGVEVQRINVSAGEDYTANWRQEATWETFSLKNCGAYLQAGENVIAVHALNTGLTSSDVSFDLTLSAINTPGIGPSPMTKNNSWAVNAPPNIRQVKHIPEQPMTNTAVTITAKVTDTNGVSQVMLHYQIVEPGHFIPAYLPVSIEQIHTDYTTPQAINPAFENSSNWTSIAMSDDGNNGDLIANDDIYSAIIPGQSENRTLVRYRISVTDSLAASVRVPFADDSSLNFAYFVYNGVPAYQASTSVNGSNHTYSPEVMNSLPVYTLITRPADFQECWAYDESDRLGEGDYGGGRGHPSRWVYNWEAAFFYNGKVYDHVGYRLAGANSRYVPFTDDQGYKRSMRIKFKRGNHCQFYNEYGKKYPEKWRILAIRKCFAGFSLTSYHKYGLNEMMNTRLYDLANVPCQESHYFHFRVVDGEDEVPSSNGQYYGDFYGLFGAFERYDSKFLDAHDLEDGNMYKHTDYVTSAEQQQRVQGITAVQDQSDFYNITANMDTSASEAWTRQQINEERNYRYWTVSKAIAHNDINPDYRKNMVWYFQPSATNPLGEYNIFAYDTDISWGEPTSNPGDDAYIAIFDSTNKDQMQLEFRNYVREFLDLVWQEDVINTMIDEIYNRISVFHQADRDRWKEAPYDAGQGDNGALEPIVDRMKQFAFTGYSGDGTYAAGALSILQDLAAEGDDNDFIPTRPTISYSGLAGFPANNLSFECSDFSDPQGAGSFAAMQWRIGAIDDTSAPSFDINGPRTYEADPIWLSPEFTVFNDAIDLPVINLDTNKIYRARVRMKDNTGRWSHWSTPYEFKVTPISAANSLVVSEIMYHPPAPISSSIYEDNDFEFIEIYNHSNGSVDLNGVSFINGIDFVMQENFSLASTNYAVLVRNLTAFAERYDTNDINIIGVYTSKLSNSGEQITLADNSTTFINDFYYLDTWYPVTDGAGFSLVLADLNFTNQNLSLESSWRPSNLVDGSPGKEDVMIPEPMLLSTWILLLLGVLRFRK